MTLRKTLMGIAVAALPMAAILYLPGCQENDANVASRNISTAADNFEINRRIVFYNGMTGEYLLEIEGLCALGNSDSALRMSVICKTKANEYKKHFLGLGSHVTFFAEQLEPAKASVYRYRVAFKPSTIVPAVELR